LILFSISNQGTKKSMSFRASYTWPKNKVLIN